jgi:hypothetical protein
LLRYSATKNMQNFVDEMNFPGKISVRQISMQAKCNAHPHFHLASSIGVSYKDIDLFAHGMISKGPKKKLRIYKRLVNAQFKPEIEAYEKRQQVRKKEALHTSFSAVTVDKATGFPVRGKGKHAAFFEVYNDLDLELLKRWIDEWIRDGVVGDALQEFREDVWKTQDLKELFKTSVMFEPFGDELPVIKRFYLLRLQQALDKFLKLPKKPKKPHPDKSLLELIAVMQAEIDVHIVKVKQQIKQKLTLSLNI